MEYSNLGKTGLKVSRIGLGAWQFGDKGWGWGTTVTEADAQAILQTAFDSGINFIDTAEVYGQGISEQVVGSFIKKVGRDNVVIATKVSGQHLRFEDILKAAQGSLSRLGISTIDLYQVHWPNNYIALRQTMKAIEELVDKGKVRFIGLSNFSKPLIIDAQENLSKHKIVSNQVRYNLVQREIEEEILRYCRKENIAIIAYSPLAQGLLTGKYEKPDLAEQDLRKNNILFNPVNTQRLMGAIQLLKEMATKYNQTPSQVALNWLIYQPDVFPIPGAKKQSQVVENAGAVGWRLKKEDVELLNRAAEKIEVTYFV